MFLYDPVRRVIAACHAGWRGTALGITKKEVEAMTAAYGTDPKDLLAAIGPGIGEGIAVSKALEGMARQPEATSTLRTNMILGCAIAETTGIYSLLISFLILFAVN